MKSKQLLKVCLAWFIMTLSAVQAAYAGYCYISPSTLSLKPGETATVRAYYDGYDGNWWSFTGNKSIAYITSPGGSYKAVEVKAVGEGSTYIECEIYRWNGATRESSTHRCNITVIADPPTNISLDKTTLDMQVNETKQLTATVSPSTASQKVTWEVLEEGFNVASVNSSGLVTAKTPGEATVRVKSVANNSIYKDCKVKVYDWPTSVSLNKTNLNLELGDTTRLIATVSPEGAFPSISWSKESGNNAITLGSNGLITAKAVGTVNVMAQSTINSSAYAICTVTVTEPTLKPGVLLGNTLTIGDNASNSTSIVPYSNSYKYSTVQTLYSPTEIGKSGKIKSIAFKVANAANHATSRVRVYLGHKSGTFGSSVNSSNLTLVYSGTPMLGHDVGWETLPFNQGFFTYNGTDNLVVVVTREAAEHTSALQYYCYSGKGYTLYRRNDSNTDYANISNTSNSYTTSTERPAVRLEFEGVSPTGINLNSTSVRLRVGETKQLTATVLPSEASQSVTWSSDTPDVATVEDGKVTALSSGTAYITATTTDNPNISATCKVTVEDTPGTTGDVNGDSFVNGTDLVMLANIVLGKQAETTAADVNKDGSVNGTDIVALANIILGRASAPKKAKALAQSNGDASLSIEDFDIKAGETKEMIIDLNNPNDELTLVQFDLHLPEGLSIKETGGELDIDMCDRTTWRKHSLDANKTDDYYRFLLYSSSNAVISGTQGGIIKITLTADNDFTNGTIRLDNILLVTPDQTETKPAEYEYHIGSSSENWHDGDVFAETINGVNMKFMVISAKDKTCAVSGGLDEDGLGLPAIDIRYAGEITIPSMVRGVKVKSIGIMAFDFCENVTSVNISEGIEEIEPYAFGDCESLTCVRLPESLKRILRGAFNDCYSLESIFIPKNVCYLAEDDEWEDHCFVKTPSLTSIIVDKDNAYYDSRDNCNAIISKATNTLIVGCNNTVVPNSITSIGRSAFYWCKHLTSITIPKNVKSLGNYFIVYCDNLATIYSMIENPFDVDGKVFYYGPSNEDRYYREVTLYVPKGTKILYEKKDGWKNFRNIVEMEAPVQEDAPLTIAKDFCISSGETEEMVIELTNTEDEITLVQFDLYLPEGLSIKETNGELDFDMCDRTSWRKHTLDVNKIDDFYRFLLYSSSNTIISGTEGGIIKVTIAADENFTEGTIHIDNILLVAPDQAEIKPASYDFEVAIQDIKANTNDGMSSIIFNLSGQRLTKFQHGVNITNGKKVMVK